MRHIAVIAHNIRSTHNVGSILRTAECLGATEVILSGYTPYPHLKNDQRLPHISNKLHNQIHKTALGAEELISWRTEHDVERLIRQLKATGFKIVALEQSKRSVDISSFIPENKIALLLGSEVDGVDKALLDSADHIIEIKQYGKKESLNVAQACAIALYALQQS